MQHEDSSVSLKPADHAPAPIYLWNPAGFDPVAYLGDSLRKRADLARFVVHKIVWANVFEQIDGDGFTRLKAEYLRNFFPDNLTYSQVMKGLTDGGAIVCDGHYVKGEKALGYKLGPGLVHRRHERACVTDRRLYQKIYRSRDDMRKSLKGVHRHLYDHLETVRIDHQAALEGLPMEDFLGVVFDPTYATSIELIRDRQFLFHVCPYGRVHTNLTNLRRGLRKYLSAQGEPLVNLDIRNSQPLIFAAILKDHYEFTADTARVPRDVLRYVELVQAGGFYDYLMSEWGIDPSHRSAFKVKFFAHVFFCKNFPVTKYAEMFASLFPNVHSVVRRMKEPDHAALAKDLQRRESSIIIGGVAARCMAELPHVFIATIHDSVLTTPPYADAVKGIMADEFLRVGLVPKIEDEVA